MGRFDDFLRKLNNFLTDAEEQPESKIGPGIQELAVSRIQALQNRWEILEAQVGLAVQSRHDLQKQVTEAKAVEAIGKQALIAGNTRKAQAAMARYADMQQTIQQIASRARKADEQAAAAITAFSTEARAAQQLATEARALAQLESVIELQKKHQALTITQSTTVDEFEVAREALLLKASVQAAVMSLQEDQDTLRAELTAIGKRDEMLAVGERWQREIEEVGMERNKAPRFSISAEDPARQAITFLEQPPFKGMIADGSQRNR